MCFIPVTYPSFDLGVIKKAPVKIMFCTYEGFEKCDFIFGPPENWMNFRCFFENDTWQFTTRATPKGLNQGQTTQVATSNGLNQCQTKKFFFYKFNYTGGIIGLINSPGAPGEIFREN